MSKDKYLKIKERFEANSNNTSAEKMEKYMKNKFIFYGVPASLRKDCYKDILKEAKSEDIDWKLLDICYDDEHREFQYFVVDYLTAMKKKLVFSDIEKILKYIKDKQWWDTIDGFDRIIGELADNDEGKELMINWSVDEDLWIRRIAINHQLGKRKDTDKELLEKIIINNLGTDEFFINKAIGWSLREYSKTDPQWVENFIKKYEDKMSKLSIREAGKYL